MIVSTCQVPFLSKHRKIYILVGILLDIKVYILYMKMVKLQFANKKQYKITLPKQIVEAKGWKKGDEIKIRINDKGEIVITR